MKVRIGIDVGGTFTDVVAIDQETHELIGKLKLPTTHNAREGVAKGIVAAIEEALRRFGISPGEVVFIAHSTTQATNALLEGDVEPVGIIGIGEGIEGHLARRATRVPPIRLTARKSLAALHDYVAADTADFAGAARAAIERLAALGARVIVASEAFGVDQTERESLVADQARAAGWQATTGHEVSSLYGLRVRTRTAVINAAILPKMIETARMTDLCVRESGIESPLMIMRSDGGVMSVAEVHRRPILTMLSGPAAGIAGALMHERVSDGIFIEVGGTSADISVIRDGNPATRPARISGHRMYLDTLDVRTLGVGGGSMIRVGGGESGQARLVDLGPRSAHIAGLGYACYADPADLDGATVEIIRPTEGDECDHVALRTREGRRLALTTTCAANCLGLVAEEQFARGNGDSAHRGFALLAAFLGEGEDADQLARSVLLIGSRKIAATIEELIVEYRLARDQAVLVGGGGGAASLVPFTGQEMGIEYRIARNAEVISPIGVAMAMVRDSVERNIVDPSPEDILRVRREATDAAIAAGATPDSVEVTVEVDKRRNLVRAIAVGATEMRRRDQDSVVLDQAACRAAAARSMRLPENLLHLEAEVGSYLVFSGLLTSQSLFGLWRRRQRMLRVVDRSGVVRLQRGAAHVTVARADGIAAAITSAVEQLTDFGDAGRTIPDLFLLYGPRLANFSGLATLEQVLALVEVELRSLDPETAIAIVASPR